MRLEGWCPVRFCTSASGGIVSAPQLYQLPALYVFCIKSQVQSFDVWERQAGGAAAAEAVLRRVLACCRGTASLVELGCGSSSLAQRAKALGFWPVLATDASQVRSWHPDELLLLV